MIFNSGDRVRLTDKYVNAHKARADRIKLLALVGEVINSGLTYSSVKWDNVEAISHTVFTHIIEENV